MPGPSSCPCSGRRSLEAQRVAAPSRPARPRHRATPATRPRVIGRHGDLDAVLAGVARAGHDAQHAVDLGTLPRKRPTAAASGQSSAAARPRRRALHGDHGPARRGLLSADRGDRAVGVEGVGHHVEHLVVDPPDDDVVEDRAVLLVEEVGVLRPSGSDLGEVVGEAPTAAGRGRRRLRPGTVPRCDTSNITAARRRRSARRSCPSPYARASPSRRRAPSSPRAHGARRRGRVLVLLGARHLTGRRRAAPASRLTEVQRLLLRALERLSLALISLRQPSSDSDTLSTP